MKVVEDFSQITYYTYSTDRGDMNYHTQRNIALANTNLDIIGESS